MKSLAVALLVFGSATAMLSLVRNPSPIAAPRAPAVTGNGSPSSWSQPAALLFHPIDFKASVCQSDYGEQPVCRFYTERTK